MRRILHVMSRTTIAALFVALAGAEGAEGRCQVLVMSRPAGATVYVDGEERGQSPTTVEDLDIGKHEVRMVLEGYVAWTRRVQLKPGANTVEATLEEEKGAPAPEAGEGGEKAPAEEGEYTGAGKPDEGAAGGKSPADEAPADGAEEKVPRRIPVPCPCCEGKGVIETIGCVTCEADGLDGTRACAACKVTGRMPANCPSCRGQGSIFTGGKRVECRSCAGTGRPRCPLCKGTKTVLRPNPEAVGYPTTPCMSCGGSGAEQEEKCRRCGSRGTIDVHEVDGARLRYGRVPCRWCGGDGIGPPVCMRCRGRGYQKQEKFQQAAVPCAYCGGTGRLFTPCRNCRGAGWVRER